MISVKLTTPDLIKKTVFPEKKAVASTANAPVQLFFTYSICSFLS